MIDTSRACHAYIACFIHHLHCAYLLLLCFCCASTLSRAPLGVRARSLVARPSETLSGVVPYGFNSTFWRSQNGLRSATVRLKSWTCIIFSKFFSPSAADDARASRPWPVVPRRDVARGRDERAVAAAGGGTRRIFEPCSSARARGRRSLARQPSVAAAVPGVRRKRLALASHRLIGMFHEGLQ